MSFAVNHLIGFGGRRASAPPTISYRASAIDGVPAATFTFASLDIGTAATNRFVVVGVGTRHNTSETISGVTIAGGSATLLASQNTSVGAENNIAALYGALVPSGSTGDVVVTLSGSIAMIGVGVWAAYGLASVTPAVTATSVANPAVLDVNVNTGDIIIAMSSTGGSGVFATSTWSGVTERFDINPAGVGYMSGADHAALISESPRTITDTYAANNNRAACCAVLR